MKKHLPFSLLILLGLPGFGQTIWLQENFSSSTGWNITTNGPFTGNDIVEASIDTGYLYLESLHDGNCPEAQAEKTYSGVNTPSGDYDFEIRIKSLDYFQTGAGSSLFVFKNNGMELSFSIPDDEYLTGELVLRKCGGEVKAYLNGNLLSFVPFLTTTVQNSDVYIQFYTLACGFGSDHRAKIVVDEFKLQECTSLGVNDNLIPALIQMTGDAAILISNAELSWVLYNLSGQVIGSGTANNGQSTIISGSGLNLLQLMDSKGNSRTHKVYFNH